jgi:outer membrane biosynthesis protein TonB
MKKILIAVLLLSLTFAGTVVAKNDKVTICHATSSETNPFVTLTISANAVYGPGGHFNENGTTQAGHEQDYFGECETPEPTPTPEPTATPEPTPTPTPEVTPSPTPEVTPTPTPEPTPEPTPTPSPEPSGTPEPSTIPEVTPTPPSGPGFTLPPTDTE